MAKKRILRLVEKRKHPRFLLSGELFRELKTGKIYPVFDLSMTGLSINTDEKVWPVGSVVKGTLNLHMDSIEVAARVLDYYGSRVALRLEIPSTYTRGVLLKALHPKRLGTSLKLIKEKLPFAEYWFHGACNTDVLVNSPEPEDQIKIEIFFSNYYCLLDHELRTGVCQSMGLDRKQELFLSGEPVTIEALSLVLDSKVDDERVNWAKEIIVASNIEEILKGKILKKFQILVAK
ncbi:MAG: PilZ domain-containing protein [Bacteriovoracia bacterium]